MVFVNEKTKDGVWQTIDREQGVALVYKGRMGAEVPYGFDFYYGDDVVKLFAFRKIQKSPSGEQDITWEIVNLVVPENLQSDFSKILNLIQEAFDACGFLFTRDHASSVTVLLPTSSLDT